MAGRGTRGGLHFVLPCEMGGRAHPRLRKSCNDSRDAGWEFTDTERSQAGVIEGEKCLSGEHHIRVGHPTLDIQRWTSNARHPKRKAPLLAKEARNGAPI